VRLFDAAACPYCARVRLVLAEKGCEVETVAVDLSNRPEELLRINPTGLVPVLDDGFVLPESLPIMEYLEERFPEPALLPRSAAERALARVAIWRFDAALGDDYYARRRGAPHSLAERLDALPVGLSLLSDFVYLPWVMRARERYGVTLPSRLEAWLAGLSARPSVAAELAVVRGLG